MSPSETKIDQENNEEDEIDPIETETLCSTLWGPPRSVILHRNEHSRSLGISIVGGKLDFSGPGNTVETCISGIFVKHVIPESPAGRSRILKTGDRILEVNTCNLRDATHDQAVEIIRASTSPICFVVQSLPVPLPLPLPSTSNTQPMPIAPIDDNPRANPYGHLQGELLLIDVKRTETEINEPLGLSVIGHRDPDRLAVFVCDVQEDSLLGRDGRLEVGDQLPQVRSISMSIIHLLLIITRSMMKF
jgi:InaD-like protein